MMYVALNTVVMPSHYALTTTTTTTTANNNKISPFLVWLYGKYLKHDVCHCLSPVTLESDADHEDHSGYIS
jgi:hypothetical protein